MNDTMQRHSQDQVVISIFLSFGVTIWAGQEDHFFYRKKIQNKTKIINPRWKEGGTHARGGCQDGTDVDEVGFGWVGKNWETLAKVEETKCPFWGSESLCIAPLVFMERSDGHRCTSADVLARLAHRHSLPKGSTLSEPKWCDDDEREPNDVLLLSFFHCH